MSPQNSSPPNQLNLGLMILIYSAKLVTWNTLPFHSMAFDLKWQTLYPGNCLLADNHKKTYHCCTKLNMQFEHVLTKEHQLVNRSIIQGSSLATYPQTTRSLNLLTRVRKGRVGLEPIPRALLFQFLLSSLSAFVLSLPRRLFFPARSRPWRLILRFRRVRRVIPWTESVNIFCLPRGNEPDGRDAFMIFLPISLFREHFFGLKGFVCQQVFYVARMN